MQFLSSVIKPDDIEVDVRIIMTLGQWKKLLDQLNQNWPSSEISIKLNEVVYKIEKENLILD